MVTLQGYTKGLFLLTSYVVLNCWHWLGYFIYFKFAYVFFYLLSLIQLKKKDRLISKEMCALLFDVFDHCSLVQFKFIK